MCYSKIYLLLLLTMVLTGCVETIVMDPDEKDMPVVVNCILDFQAGGYPLKPEGGRGLSLTLQYVKGKAAPEFIPVEDAVVYLERPAETSPYLKRIPFIHKGRGVWESEEIMTTYIHPNEQYILNVEIPGRERIWAETWTQPDMDLILHHDIDEELMYSIEVKGDGLENYCLWAFGIEDMVTGGRWDEDPLDYLVTNHPYADLFNVTELHYSDLNFQGIPTDGLGLAYQEAFGQAKEKLADMPLFENFIRIDNLNYDKPFFLFPGPLCPPNNYIGHYVRPNGYSWMVCYFVSKELDRYLRSVYIHNRSLNTNLAHVYSVANDIYTNIHGGLGIFGSRYVCVYNFLSDKFDVVE